MAAVLPPVHVYLDHSSARLVSRNGNTFKSFAGLCTSLTADVRVRDCILDGGIVCLGSDGRSLFEPLLYHRAEPYFYAFGCLWLDGRDLHHLPLIERKAILRGLVPPQPSRLPYVDHVLRTGVELYRAVCAMDLQGIVAKWKDTPYGTDPSSWITDAGIAGSYRRDPEMFYVNQKIRYIGKELLG